MNSLPIIFLIVIGIITLMAGALFILWPLMTGHTWSSSTEGLKAPKPKVEKNKNDPSLSEYKPISSEISLEKRMKYGEWTMPILQYYLLAGVVSFICFIIAFMKLNVVFQAISIFVGPIFMSALLNRSINTRFKAFDRDYAPFLLSLVGLLKTGMNPLQALGVAANGLDQSALVRNEVEVMLERLRLGVSEDKSIGAFGEEINHPEIELFVQALLLSRRVGGTLSDTLERLSKQVRRRQYFREQAVAAIGMQRGSIWFLIGIQCSLMVFIYIMVPRFIIDSTADPTGWQIWQFGILIVIVALVWIRKVSKIKC